MTKKEKDVLRIKFENEEIIRCKDCDNKIMAGPSWVLFCPYCFLIEKGNVSRIEKVMSCVHCEKPLSIHRNDEGRLYGRCHTKNCGDCHSMQDLCLINLSTIPTLNVDIIMR